MTLAAFDLLGRIVTTRPAALGGLDRLTVDDPRRWAGFTTCRFARLQQQLEIDLLKQAGVPPIVKIALHRRERGKVLRQHAPLAAGPRDIQDRVKHGSQLNLTRPAQRLGRRHMRLDQPPFWIRDIACVALLLSLILPPSDFGPHLVPRRLLVTTTMPQQIEIAQFIFGQPLSQPGRELRMVSRTAADGGRTRTKPESLDP